MNIQFNHIIPEPLKEVITEHPTQIWNQKLTLTSGEKIVIEAPSGKGKSTFLNIIFGVRTDYDGELLFNQDLASKNEKFNWNELRTSEISMVHQGLELFDGFSALQNVILKNQLTGFKTQSEIDEMFERLDIAKLKNQRCHKLSFGQKQRVAIIRALCQPFNWLLLDEPFSHLDINTAQTALDLIMSEADSQNAGVILTSLNSLENDSFTKKLLL